MVKKVLIISENLRDKFIVAESQENVPSGCMRIQGIVAVTDIENENHRTYKRAEYQRILEKFANERLAIGCYGELEHPKSMGINYERMTHKVENVWIDENGVVMGQFLLMDTPLGNLLQSVAKTGGALRASSRAVGTIDNNGFVTLDEMATYDMVGQAGFKQSEMYPISESFVQENDVNVMKTMVFELNSENKVQNANVTESLENVSDEKIESIVEKLLNEKISKTNTKSIDEAVIAQKVASSVQSFVDEHFSAKLNDLEKRIQNRIVESATKIGEGLDKWVDDNNIQESLSADDVKTMLFEYSKTYVLPTVQEWCIGDFAEQIQTWVVEDYSPEVQKWTIDEFAPEIQNWAIEEMLPEVQNWVVEEYSPVVQNWVVEEYSKSVQEWVTEDFANVVNDWVVKDVIGEENITENLNENLNDNKQNIIKKKTTMENLSPSQKQLKLIDDMISEADGLSTKKVVIIEDAFKIEETEPQWLQDIPESLKYSWFNASVEKQNEIKKQAELRDLTESGNVVKFWNTRNWVSESIVQKNNIVTETKRVNPLVTMAKKFM